jgi:hypothetical protein
LGQQEHSSAAFAQVRFAIMLAMPEQFLAVLLRQLKTQAFGHGSLSFLLERNTFFLALSFPPIILLRFIIGNVHDKSASTK